MLSEYAVLKSKFLICFRALQNLREVLSLQTFTPELPSEPKPLHLYVSPCLFLPYTLYHKTSYHISVSKLDVRNETGKIRSHSHYSFTLCLSCLLSSHTPVLLPVGFTVSCCCVTLLSTETVTRNTLQQICCQNYVSLLQSNPFIFRI